MQRLRDLYRSCGRLPDAIHLSSCEFLIDCHHTAHAPARRFPTMDLTACPRCRAVHAALTGFRTWQPTGSCQRLDNDATNLPASSGY